MRSTQDMYKEFPGLIRSSYPLYIRTAGPQVCADLLVQSHGAAQEPRKSCLSPVQHLCPLKMHRKCLLCGPLTGTPM